MMRNRLKTILCLVCVCLLVFPAATPVFGVSASDFTDQFDPYQPDNASYWGWSYIDTAAREGIIEGYEQPGGTRIFLPRNDVTKQEAVTMIVNTISRAMLGYPAFDPSSAALSEKWAETLTAANIAEWAYPYVSYALENGFLTSEEALLFMEPSDPEKTGLAFVSNPASREEVITWVGRALWKRYAKAEGSVFSLTYTDADDVSSVAAPYLALLTRIGIIEGIGEPDGTYHFDPKRTLTRVEFAVICTNVFDRPKHTLTEPGFTSAEGVVTARSDAEAEIVTFRIGNAKYYYYGGGTVLVNGAVDPDGFAAVRNGDVILFSTDVDSQIRIDTRIVSGTGRIVAIREADAFGYQLLSIVLPDEAGTTVKYYINPAADGVSVTGSIATNQSIAFLADGATLVELANN